MSTLEQDRAKISAETEELEAKPPKLIVSVFSKRLSDINPGTRVLVFPRKRPRYEAIVVGPIESSKQPTNPPIEMRNPMSHSDYTYRLGAGTSVIRLP